jgi:hypothetical protein
MESDHSYLFNLLSLAWEAAEKGAVVIDFLIAFILVWVVRGLKKRNRLPTIVLPITKHAFFEDDKWRFAMTFGVIFVLQMIFISPYSLYKKNHTKIEELQKTLNDKSPKLDGFSNTKGRYSNTHLTDILALLRIGQRKLIKVTQK